MKAWVYRALGQPVIEVNISEDQVEDAIDDGLEFWYDYHYEATQKIYIAHMLTVDDINEKRIQLDKSIMNVTRVFKFTGDANFGSPDDIFNVDYQLRLNDLWDLTSVNLSGYVIARQYISLIDDLLNSDIQVRFKQHEGILRLDYSSMNMFPGCYIMIECYQKMGYASSYQDGYDPGPGPNSVPSPGSVPVTNTDPTRSIWNDRMLRKLCAAYARLRWGRNLGKFENVALPGGVTVNGGKIMADAKEEITELEADFIRRFQGPDEFWIG